MRAPKFQWRCGICGKANNKPEGWEKHLWRKCREESELHNMQEFLAFFVNTKRIP